MGIYDWMKSPLERAIEARGERAIAGGYKPWQLAEWRPQVEGIRTAGARNLEDLAVTLPRTKVGGPAAAKMLENAYGRTNENILDLSNTLARVPEQYIGQGAEMGGKGFERALTLADVMEKYKSRHLQANMAKMQGISGGIGAGASGAGSAMGGCKCYIFMEGGGLTYNVRLYRDAHYKPNTPLSIGYEKMASWIVPKMKENKFVKWIMKKIMIDPIVSFADAYMEDSKGWKTLFYCPFGIFWTKLWDMYGRAKVAIS